VLETSDSEGDIEIAASGSQSASITSIQRAGSSLRMAASMAPLEIGLERREVAVLAFNCHGFLKIPEKETLSKYASLCALVARVAKDQRGVVDTMFGDHVMMSFNASSRNANYTQSSATAAVLLQRGCELCTAIGLATGVASVGNVGVATMVRFTVHGHVVAVANQLSQCSQDNHFKGVHICATHSTELALIARIRAFDLLQSPNQDITTSKSKMVVCEVTGLLKSPGGDEWMYEIEAHDNSDVYFHVNEGFLSLSRGNTEGATVALNAASAATALIAESSMIASQTSLMTPGSSTTSVARVCVYACSARSKVEHSVDRLKALLDG